MKTKIFKLATLLLLITMFFSSCKDDQLFLTVDETPIAVTVDGGEFFIAVESNGNWIAVVENAETIEWCALSGAKGTDDGVVSVNISKNSEIYPRSMVVQITLGESIRRVQFNQEPVENPENIEIPFTEYSLAGTSCQWVNINYGNYSFDANVIAINSSEELEEYIDCSSGSYPEIDFSKHTLLLASGRAPNGVHEISNCSLQFSNNEYQLEIRIHLEPREVIGRWIMALVVNKLREESDIDLKIIFKHP